MRDFGLKQSASYHPLLLTAIAVTLGVAIDNHCHLNFLFWLVIYIVAFLGWLVSFRTNLLRVSSLLLTISFLALAALWYNYWWNHYGVNEIGLFASKQQRPVCIECYVQSESKRIASPERSQFNPVPRGESTKLFLTALRIRHRNSWHQVSGQLDCVINGQLSVIPTGSRIRIFGQLGLVSKPTNPGQFDYQHHMRSERKLAVLNVNHPAAVVIVGKGKTRSLSSIRETMNNSIWRYVGSKRAPFASAILLGNREQLSPDNREEFMASGTVHILAISGLHVGIMAAAILFLGRLGFIQRKYCLLITVIFVLFYMWLVEFRPPVVRASILVTIYCVARWIGRNGFTFNTLGLATLVIALINPAQLLNVGTQLSFLAVASLSCFYPLIVRKPTTDPLDRLIERTRPTPVRILKMLLDRVRYMFGVSAIVWLTSAPLVAEHFNIVAPIALIVNPLLVLPLTLGLLLGFGVLVFGNVFPPLAILCGKGCDGCLYLIERIIELSNLVPFSHIWVCGPAAWAVFVFYLALFLLIIYPPSRLPKRWALVFGPAWLAFCVFLPATVQHFKDQYRQSLCCTFIDVGHGTSVLLQLPKGKTMLYDCGSFGSSRRATQDISDALWHHQINHIDVLVISHADLDHYNALPGIVERFSIGTILVSPVSLGDSVDQNFVTALRLAEAKQIPIQRVWASQQINLSSELKIDILSPPEHGTDSTDNSNSLVFCLKRAPYSILLPGDLDNVGLEKLLNQPPRSFDITMAPHHGSQNSRPQDFIEWCQPDLFVVSGDSNDLERVTEELLDELGIHLLYTARHGAIKICVSESRLTKSIWNGDQWIDAKAESPD